jgi:hypothetical protein
VPGVFVFLSSVSYEKEVGDNGSQRLREEGERKIAAYAIINNHRVILSGESLLGCCGAFRYESNQITDAKCASEKGA